MADAPELLVFAGTAEIDDEVALAGKARRAGARGGSVGPMAHGDWDGVAELQADQADGLTVGGQHACEAAAAFLLAASAALSSVVIHVDGDPQAIVADRRASKVIGAGEIGPRVIQRQWTTDALRKAGRRLHVEAEDLVCVDIRVVGTWLDADEGDPSAVARDVGRVGVLLQSRAEPGRCAG